MEAKQEQHFPVIDFPKVKSPFVRETINGRYVVTPKIEEGYEWVFEEPGVRAVDKLHGTNVCVHFKNGIVSAIDNRKNRVMLNPFVSLYIPKNTTRMLAGIINSMEKGWIPDIETGSMYGELIAPEINGNLHKVDRPYFVPFEWLYQKAHWKSWVQNKYPKTFDSISSWFRELPSLFTQDRAKQEGMAEGIMFTHPDGRMAKLRRDMFDWYEVVGHNEL